MLAKVMAPAHVGMDGTVVEVECDITNGLPAFVVVGLGNQAVNEAKDRVRGAIRNSKLVVPPKRITLNLAPADLPKDGTAYDVSMAVAVLVASGQLEEAGSSLFVGELALDGSLRPVRGVLAYAQLALDRGVRQLFVPAENASEAALIGGVRVYGAKNLLEVYGHLAGLQPLEPVTSRPLGSVRREHQVPDFSTVVGQDEAKLVLEIAAAGGHNVLLTGPPGAGKTMLSRAMIGILPPPTLPEMIEITKIHSLAGRTMTVVTERPFRNPHHTASDIALIGGGRNPRPGEISLGHRGIVFLDELPEFRRGVLEVLRQPLEDGVVTVARAAGSATFPAEFILIAAQNPCPCGYAGDVLRECSCSPSSITRYTQKVSGPLMDRIDMVVQVHRVAMELRPPGEPTAAIARRVAAARTVQATRNGGTLLNARLTSSDLRKGKISRQALVRLQQANHNLGLSARAYVRTLRVARTVADLAGRKVISDDDVAVAIRYRPTSG